MFPSVLFHRHRRERLQNSFAKPNKGEVETEKDFSVDRVLCAYLPTLSYSGEYLSADERTAVFSGKTCDGENVESGWTYRIYSHSSCDKITIRYVTQDDAGKTFERRVTRYPNGESCVKFEDGKERCTKVKVAENGVFQQYATNGNHNGEHVGNITNLVNCNQLN